MTGMIGGVVEESEAVFDERGDQKKSTDRREIFARFTKNLNTFKGYCSCGKLTPSEKSSHLEIANLTSIGKITWIRRSRRLRRGHVEVTLERLDGREFT